MSTAFIFGVIGSYTVALPSWVPSLLLSIAVMTAPLLISLFRTNSAGDGALQMSVLTAGALAIGFNPWAKPAIGQVALIFIAAQACSVFDLRRLQTNFADLDSWRATGRNSGNESVRKSMVLRCGCFVAKAGQACRHVVNDVYRNRVSCRTDRSLVDLVFFLLWGATFSVANASVMGLNTFVWSFLASYPAIIYLWFKIHKGVTPQIRCDDRCGTKSEGMVLPWSLQLRPHCSRITDPEQDRNGDRLKSESKRHIVECQIAA